MKTQPRRPAFILERIDDALMFEADRRSAAFCKKMLDDQPSLAVDKALLDRAEALIEDAEGLLAAKAAIDTIKQQGRTRKELSEHIAQALFSYRFTLSFLSALVVRDIQQSILRQLAGPERTGNA
jgi:hypothetical protein